MDIWKYYDITHRKHLICNPTSEEKIDYLIELLLLDPGDKVVDIACGKGEFLVRLARRHGIRGLGVDRSLFNLEEARSRHAKSGGDITFLQIDGADFRPEVEEGFQMASCLGASFVFGGYRQTLQRLASMVGNGGWVISGEPYWRQEPPEDYLHAIESARADIGTHLDNVRAGEDVGLDLVYTCVSSKDDFDHYEALQWYSADFYSRAHPEDKDVPELLAKLRAGRNAYLQWGRNTLGWAIYVFRRPGHRY